MGGYTKSLSGQSTVCTAVGVFIILQTQVPPLAVGIIINLFSFYVVS